VALTHNSVKNNECDVAYVLKEPRRRSKCVIHKANERLSFICSLYFRFRIKLKIATTIFVQKVHTRRVPTIHINHAYPIVMTVALVVLANMRQSQ
jgi:hypothetical protein